LKRWLLFEKEVTSKAPEYIQRALPKDAKVTYKLIIDEAGPYDHFIRNTGFKED
jgi:hypothetical protein